MSWRNLLRVENGNNEIQTYVCAHGCRKDFFQEGTNSGFFKGSEKIYAVRDKSGKISF